MSTVQALVLLGLAGAGVWILTSPNLAQFFGASAGNSGSGGAGVPVNSAGRPFLTEEQINYYLSGFAKHLTSAQAAAIGANAGAPLAVATFGISAAIGALVGFLSVRTSNDALEDRIVFAKRLGFNGVGAHLAQLSSDQDTSKGLYPYLVHHGYHDTLVVKALNQIGRKDLETNAYWMLDTLVALWQSNYPFPH